MGRDPGGSAHDSRQPGQSQLRSGSGSVGEALSNIASQLLRGRKRVITETAPEARIPEQVLTQTTFQVMVCTQPQRTPNTVDRIALVRPKEGPLDLEIQIIPPSTGELVLRSPADAVLRVDTSGRAAAICFELFAAKTGTHTIEVAFRSSGVERVRLAGDVKVLAQAEYDSAAQPTKVSSLTGASLIPTAGFFGLLLQIEPHGVSADYRTYRVVLSGSAWGGVPAEGSIELPVDCARLLAELCRDMSAVAKLDGSQVREQRLRAIGQALAERVLPPKIWEHLLLHWSPGTLLHIESGELNIPWESLWLGDRNEGFFLGERFAVTRYPRLGSARDVVGGQSAVMVSPRSAGLQTDTERDALRVVAGAAPQELGQLAQVQQLLSGSTPCSILHFACHGDAVPGTSFGDLLQLDGGPLSVVDVVTPRGGQRGPLDGVLVFVNACRANSSYPSIWGHGGWARAFLRAGSGAFVAPAWTVTDVGASNFADAIYRSAASGQPLGEAARLARLRMAQAEQGCPDRLSYAVFASPNARISPALVRSTAR